MDGGAIWNAMTGITEDSWTVERYCREVVAKFGVRGSDADGLAGFQGQARRGGAEDRSEDATTNSTGVHLLELEEGLILL